MKAVIQVQSQKEKKDGEHTPIGSCEVLHVICMMM
jgi:hypothetical protein